ncbi:tetratricopeptide repeat protein [Desmonostoc muscorum CCALA 125]|nr:tetratricopeptide repeat protein [Desmonostoc muscorum CCALA 125]
MSNTQQLALSIQPVISYPRQAQVGKTYLMTIDLQSSEDEWPYEEEEYPIYCMLDTSQLFICQPLGEPAVVLHRFGGSYGAAEFLLTAAQEEMEGEITVTLVNGWGVPIRVLSLDQISVTQVVSDSQETTRSYEGVISVFKRWKINPYIVGNPIVDKDKFFGRETLLRTIEDSLQQKAKFILLHGQRRIGKSSLLKNIPLFISQDEFVFVPCDLQHHSDSTLGQILYAIANSIVETLKIDTAILNALNTQDLNNNPRILTWRFLPTVDDTLGNKKLVLLLDEFDVVSQDNTPQALKLLEFLQKLVTQEEELFVIAVVARYLKFMPNLVQLFREAPFQEIGLLDYESARKLITQPAATTLQYPKKTIDEILKFSAGHPYYTQVLCHVIFSQARDEDYSTITSTCVNDAVNLAIERSEGGSASIWEGLSIFEKVVILAVAKAQEQNASENPLKVVEVYGLVLTDSLKEAIDILINKGFLDSNPLKVKVELVRRWLVQRYQLRVEVRSLETLQQENVKQLLFVAGNWWAENRQQDALDIYEQALKENPNHFGTVVELAEKYLQVKKFDRALELYERAYKLDPTTHQQTFVNALHEYGHFLITQINYLVATQQYERILKIQPDNNLAQEKLAEIKAYQPNNQGWFGRALAAFRRIFEN